MKSLPASLALAAAAIIQAMGVYHWRGDSMAVSGQVFFPILFGLMSIYLAWRNKDSERFYVAHMILAVIGVLGLVATVIGMVGTIWALYPSLIMYYVFLLVLIVETALRIAAMPKKAKATEEEAAAEGASDDAVAQPAKRRRRRRAGSGPTHLVATSKSGASGSHASEGGSAAADADASEHVAHERTDER
ncbi:hypothetical protein [Kocuria sp. HSID16901]|uniref:hypothetical protein n=1 Tax=Kocuria sp. HSID16901 TaxID=2419505 RepID=UPI000660DB21|nr:hypothetical protein [Kocuria sp. HSID16901]